MIEYIVTTDSRGEERKCPIENVFSDRYCRREALLMY